MYINQQFKTLLSALVLQKQKQERTLEKPRVGVFDDAFAAELFDGSVSLDGDETILNVQLTKTSAVIGDGSHAFVRHKFATLDAQLFQVGAMFCQEAQAAIGHVALA